MFNLTPDQLKKLNEWLKDNPPVPKGAIGGSLTYSFTPTTLGTIVKVTNNATNKEIDLSDYEDW